MRVTIPSPFVLNATAFFLEMEDVYIVLYAVGVAVTHRKLLITGVI
jgi:hypothetical protein